MKTNKYKIMAAAYALTYGLFILPALQDYEGIFLLLTAPFLWWLVSKIASPELNKNAR